MEKSDCIFCQIVAGNIPCAKVFETDLVLAFLDIAPIRPGHALVIPKAHHETLLDVPAELSGPLFEALRRVGRAVLAATGAEGLNVGMNNYAAAGQLVPHAHFHVIPRVSGDGLSLWPGAAYDSPEAMRRLAEAISRETTRPAAA